MRVLDDFERGLLDSFNRHHWILLTTCLTRRQSCNQNISWISAGSPVSSLLAPGSFGPDVFHRIETLSSVCSNLGATLPGNVEPQIKDIKVMAATPICGETAERGRSAQWYKVALMYHAMSLLPECDSLLHFDAGAVLPSEKLISEHNKKKTGLIMPTFYVP